MKKGIHPKYIESIVECSCGEKYKVYSTKPHIVVETCKNCSPIFIGTEERKAVIGQIEKFKRRYKK
ncbi:MAG: 50S ribosomal protein L31 [Candidatus Aenigmatarchaeota archaeon]